MPITETWGPRGLKAKNFKKMGLDNCAKVSK